MGPGHIRKLTCRLLQVRRKFTEGIIMKTGYSGLDKKFNLLAPGELTVLAGPSHVGKTSLAVNIARHRLVDQEDNVVYFTLDEGIAELGERFIHLDTEIPLFKQQHRIEKGEMEDASLEEYELDIDEEDNYSSQVKESALRYQQLIEEERLTIYEGDKLTLAELQSLVYDKFSHADFIVVDEIRHLEISRDRNIDKSEDKMLSIIYAELRKLARELETPLLLLYRAGEEDARELGTEVDTVALLERPDYCSEQREWDRELKLHLNSIPEPAILHVIHNSTGPTGEHQFLWEAPLLQFKEHSEEKDKIISDTFSDFKK